jgi:hypothetical protein
VFNHAAFHPDDLDDARRGHPAVELREYAASRRTHFAGSELTPHFAGHEPRWVDYVFNQIRGELAPRRFGTLQHELHEVALDPDGGVGNGQYYGRRSVTSRSLKEFVGLEGDEREGPFAALAMWVPVTVVKLLVPETALLPDLTIKTRPFLTLSDPSLGDHAPSFRLRRSRFVSDGLRAAVGAAVGPALEWLDAEFTQLDVADGALRLVVNGYRIEPAQLDALVQAAGAIAANLVELCAPLHAPGPFDVTLGPPAPESHPPGFSSFETTFDRSGNEVLHRRAAELGLVVEDPAALHRRFPRLAIPGTSLGVLGGHLPSSEALGRLTWQDPGDARGGSVLRGGALFSASPQAQPTPPGGNYLASTDMFVDLVDDVACAWSATTVVGRIDADQLAVRALRSMRETGLADV